MQNLLLASLLASLTSLAPTVAAQQATPSQEPTEEGILAYYRPVHYDVDELLRIASDLFGRDWFPEGRTQVFNMRRLGDQILIFDRAEEVKSILAKLQAIEANAAERSRQEELQELEIRPRFVDLRTIHDLLKSARRRVLWKGNPSDSVVLLEERGVVLLREAPERLVALADAIRRVDVPPLQVRLRLQLLAPAIEGQAPLELSEELARELEAVLPGMRFQRVGMAVLESAIGSDRPIKARLGWWEARSFEAQIVPSAFDLETGTLSTRSCSLYGQFHGPEGDEREEFFSTSAVLRGGELTVLGATGRTPVFLVIEVERMS